MTYTGGLKCCLGDFAGDKSDVLCLYIDRDSDGDSDDGDDGDGHQKMKKPNRLRDGDCGWVWKNHNRDPVRRQGIFCSLPLLGKLGKIFG